MEVPINSIYSWCPEESSYIFLGLEAWDFHSVQQSILETERASVRCDNAGCWLEVSGEETKNVEGDDGAQAASKAVEVMGKFRAREGVQAGRQASKCFQRCSSYRDTQEEERAGGGGGGERRRGS